MDQFAVEKRKYRYAVVLGMVNGRIAVAPCTTWPARHGLCVPRGHALVQNSSPAFEGSGFTAEAVSINIQEAGLFTIGSRWVRKMRQVGVLDTELDKHLHENFARTDAPVRMPVTDLST